MRILITGGAGFIGGHLAHALVAEGHEVAVVEAAVDDFSVQYFAQPVSAVGDGDEAGTPARPVFDLAQRLNTFRLSDAEVSSSSVELSSSKESGAMAPKPSHSSPARGSSRGMWQDSQAAPSGSEPGVLPPDAQIETI